MKALLHTDGLAVGHGRKALLEDVALQLAPGSLVALIGVNGSGKSTLLRTLAGLHAPMAGRVLLGDADLAHMGAAARARQLALVLTGRPAVGLLDVRTVVALGRHPWTGHLGRMRAADHQRVEEAMERTGVQAFARRGLDELSDGEVQKVMIARALAQDTPVLLLDEPTAYLDLVNRVLLMQLLRSIAHDLGKAVLLSSHDLRTVLDLADQLLLVHERKLWSGSPAEAVDGGVLSEAFRSGGLRFDAATGTLAPDA